MLDNKEMKYGNNYANQKLIFLCETHINDICIKIFKKSPRNIIVNEITLLKYSHKAGCEENIQNIINISFIKGTN